MKRISISKRTRFAVLKRDGFKCVYCGRPATQIPLEVDHVLALANGGGNEIENLATACYDCNTGKSAVLLVGQICEVVRIRTGRPPVMIPCGWCAEDMSISGLRAHASKCPKRPESFEQYEEEAS